MKKIWRDGLKIIIVGSILFLPFLHITELISIEIIVDSFENPQHYLCLESDNLFFASKTVDNDFIILQKSSHPNFIVDYNDIIIYFTDEGKIERGEIINMVCYGNRAKFYIEKNGNAQFFPIFEEQIIGKIIKNIDDNIFNSISIKIWEASINNLNIRAITD